MEEFDFVGTPYFDDKELGPQEPQQERTYAQEEEEIIPQQQVEEMEDEIAEPAPDVDMVM